MSFDPQQVLERIAVDELVELALELSNFDSPTGEEGPVAEYVYDWLKRDHPAWLEPRPKGFIPTLTGASALMWIEDQLRDGRPSDSARKELEAMRRQALRGALSDDEFRELRRKLRPTVEPLRGMLRRMKSLGRQADRLPRFPAEARAALDEAIRALERTLGSHQQMAKLLTSRAIAGLSASGLGLTIELGEKAGLRLADGV